MLLSGAGCADLQRLLRHRNSSCNGARRMKVLNAEARSRRDDIERYINGEGRKRGCAAPVQPCIACDGTMHLRKYTRLLRFYWRCDRCNCKDDLRTPAAPREKLS